MSVRVAQLGERRRKVRHGSAGPSMNYSEDGGSIPLALFGDSMARLYTFNVNGSVEVLTLADAVQRTEPDVVKRVEQIRANIQNKRMVKDGFEPGWQENIQAYCGDRRQYDQALKDRGLVEIGKDYVPTDSTNDENPVDNQQFLENCLEAGIELSGNEAEAIQTGEYFKD